MKSRKRLRYVNISDNITCWNEKNVSCGKPVVNFNSDCNIDCGSGNVNEYSVPRARRRKNDSNTATTLKSNDPIPISDTISNHISSEVTCKSHNQLFHGKTFVVSTTCQASNQHHDNSSRQSLQQEQQQQYTYKYVTQLIQQHGGTVSGQVSKKQIYCVIASPSALGGVYYSNQKQNKNNNNPTMMISSNITTLATPTQRVRKAILRNIPIMTIQYLLDCIQQQTIIPLHDKNYRITNNDIQKQDQHDIVVPSNIAIIQQSQLSSPVILEGTKMRKSIFQDVSKNQDMENQNHRSNIPKISKEEEGSITINLGCCCICHEEDWAHACEWCTNCV